jgi:serine/threonine protein kinase/uncharacterized RDD family membrane protein YckC
MGSDKLKEQQEVDIVEADGQAESSETPRQLSTPQQSSTPNSQSLIDDRFEVIKTLGSGGMGTVFKVRELSTKKVWALKVISRERLNQPNSMARFKQEAEAISTLSHPAIAALREYGQDSEGTPFLLMDYLEGSTLHEMLGGRGPFDRLRATKIILEVCRGLSHAHERGVVHRDIKPSNVFLSKGADDAQENVQILDFGIARVFDEANAHMPLTETGELLGTPWYMSPEQCFGKVADVRSDIYQVACLYYELLSGKPLFGGATAFEVMFKHVSNLPELEGCSSQIKSILEKALQKNPDARYQSMSALIEDLQSVSVSDLPAAVGSLPARADQTERSNKQGAAGSMLWRRCSAAALDALLIAITFSTLISLLQAANVVSSPFSTVGVLSHCFCQTLSCFGFAFVDSFLVWPALLLSVIPDSMNYFGPFTLSRLIPGLSLVWHSYIPLLLCFVNWLYHSLFERSRLQGTPGKILFGLKVQTSAAARPTFLQVSKRHFVKAFSFLLIPELCRLALALFRRKAFRAQAAEQLRRPAYDKAADCVVVSGGSKKHNTLVRGGVVLILCLSLMRCLPLAAFFAHNYDLAVFLDRSFTEAYEQRAGRYLLQGKFKEAVRDLSYLETRVPDQKLDLYQNLARWEGLYKKKAAAFFQLHDYLSAVKACETGKERLQSMIELGLLQSKILAFGGGKFDAALKNLNASGSRDRLLQACLSGKVGLKDEAQFQYELIAGITPAADQEPQTKGPPELSINEDPRTTLDKAVALMELGKPESALEACALVINSQVERKKAGLEDGSFYEENCIPVPWENQFVLASAYLVRGEVLEGLARKTEASRDFEHSIEAFSVFLSANQQAGFDSLDKVLALGRAHLGRAKAYRFLGRQALAEADWRAATNLGVCFEGEDEYAVTYEQRVLR